MNTTAHAKTALNAAAEWLLTEPGDKAADDALMQALVRAEYITGPADVIRVICGHTDDTTVLLVTTSNITSLDTLTKTVTITTFPVE